MQCKTYSCLAATLLTLVASGCQTNAGTGALTGGALGAGLGAIVGHQFHNTGAGAVIGAGAGALAGAATGSAIDQSEARNRALIAQRLGRPVAGQVTMDDAIAMTKAGVDEDVIVGHIRSVGVAKIPDTSDVIYLSQNGVSKRVIETMQTPPVQQARPVIVEQAPPPVIVERPYYDPYWGGGYYHRPYYPYGGPGVSVGVGIR